MSSRRGPGDDAAPATLRPAQLRIISAATELFAQHGVGGTSLQMIADEIGVTKAAVYHQYPTKDEIVLAAAEFELAKLAEVVDAAETEPSAERRRDALLAGMVELAVTRRRTTGTILGDPVIVGFFAEHDTFRDVMRRLRQILIGDQASAESRIELAMVMASISGVIMNPLVVDLDDDTLRVQLLRLARRFLGLPG